MFNIGDYVIYGTNGVCKVEKIGAINDFGISNDRVYYTLCPRYKKDSKIFTPIDSNKVIMRPVMSKDEAMQLIDEINDIESLWIPDEKRRETEYKEAIKTCSCRELIKIIKTIYLRKESRLAEGKKVTIKDEMYFSMAEDNLYGELAISLKMDKEAVKEFVVTRVDQLKTALE
jgi:CarD family transcriptional regulator